jgi:serine/threonine protein kinase
MSVEISYLSPQGVLEVEHAALRELEKKLPQTWRGFAAFRLLTRGSRVPLDVDLLVLTTNRILVVELKNWAGDIEYVSGQWVHKGRPIKSPVDVTDNKVRALKDFIRDRYSALKIPLIQTLVVLCHPKCRLLNLPAEQSEFVTTLADFTATASDPRRYYASFPDRSPTMRYASSNPLANRKDYNALFNPKNPSVLRRHTVLHGFEQTDNEADYVHPRKIWAEFRAEHQENRSSKALLRKWNFDELSGGGTSTVERQSIGLRELRLNEMLRIQSPDLHTDMLEPIGSATAEDITTNFVEAYRLPAGVERLAEHLARNADMPQEARRALAKSILTRFAKLHSLGIAHRDITKRTLWIVEPSRVILSTFAAARIPQTQTVGVHRFELETGSIDLPEDEELTQRPHTSDPFARDVFLLGVLVYEMLEGRELERVNRVPLYDIDPLLAAPALAHWYAKAMDWDPAARYKTASEALDALNEHLAVDLGPEVTATDFEAYRTDASPFNLPNKRSILQTVEKVVYESEHVGARVLVKCWPNLRFDAKYAARNLRLLTFLEHARSLRQSGFDAAPEVLDFGVSQFGLMLITRWVDGQVLSDWAPAAADNKRRAQVALALLNSVRRLHVLGLSHGDIKADNVVIAVESSSDVPSVVLIDIPDLSADGDEGVTLGAIPSSLEGASPQHRDTFAVCTLALTLLSEEYAGARQDISRALELTESLPPLDLLAETLKAELDPKVISRPAYNAILKRRGRSVLSSLELITDNGELHVRVLTNSKNRQLRFYVVGVKQQLYIKFDPDEQMVLDAALDNVEHHEYVNAFRRKQFSLSADIKVSYEDATDIDPLASVLFQIYSASTPEEISDDAVVLSAAVDPYARDGAAAPASSVSSTALWTALAETDEMNVTAVTLRSGVKQFPPESGNWLMPFDADGGVLDFAEEEEIELLERREDPHDGIERWFTVGRVVDIGKDTMKVRPLSTRFAPKEGSAYYLRGTLARVASERRIAAMKRVLAGGALIPNLVDYFDPDSKCLPRKTDNVTPEDVAEYGLNEQQEEALQTALTYGPVSLLQGPPGTGKTKFIASFVHLLLSRDLAGNILLVSQSHEAVNNVMNKVAALVRESGLDVPMVRIGQQSMVSASLRNIQEDSLRQSYRESFDAEVKERIRAVGLAMGLPSGYVYAATELHTSLGALLERIAVLGDRDDVEDDGEAQTAEHVERLRQVFADLATSRFEMKVNASDDLEAVLRSALDAIAARHDSPSPAKCERLQQIARLSTEFSRVLRNPKSNYTSFLARSSSVVAGTCVGVGKQALGIVDVPYDWVIVDEAARASPMELVVAMQAGKRVLLVGDHLQLPPSYPQSVEAETAKLLGVSRKDFRRINNFKSAFSSTYGQAAGRTLRIQYRMASAINTLVSHCFYSDSPLEVGRDAPGDEYQLLPAFLSKQVVWVDTQDQGRSAFHRSAGTHEGALVNEVEASAVVEVVRAIVSSSNFIQRVTELDTSGEAVIGVIAMYAAQRDLIRRKLEQADWAVGLRDLFTVGTVDSYQGKENRIIVLSVVRNNAGDGHIGFLSDPERINVAMSRAKDRLVIVSSSAMWRSRTTTPMKRVLDEVTTLEATQEALFVPSNELKRSVGNA